MYIHICIFGHIGHCSRFDIIDDYGFSVWNFEVIQTYTIYVYQVLSRKKARLLRLNLKDLYLKFKKKKERKKKILGFHC